LSTKPPDLTNDRSSEELIVSAV